MSERQDNDFTPTEIARRFQHGLERSLVMQHKPQRPMKQKKRGRPRKRKLTPRR